jgi:hypothetical protein
MTTPSSSCSAPKDAPDDPHGANQPRSDSSRPCSTSWRNRTSDQRTAFDTFRADPPGPAPAHGTERASPLSPARICRGPCQQHRGPVSHPGARAPLLPSARSVIYHHQVEHEERPFPYYLFSRRELAAELSAAGFVLEVLESDSILPERRLIRSPALATVDDILRRLLPAWAGYGLRATIRAGSR